MKALRNSFRGRGQQLQEDAKDSPHRSQWKGKEKEVDPEPEPRESRVASKAREIRAWMMGKSGSELHRSVTQPARVADQTGTSYATKTRKRHTTGGTKDMSRSHHGTSKTGDRGPRPGQTYEIVDHRVVENNPERTVEISTWREHASRNVLNEEDERMSIYYLSADDYAQDTVDGNTKAEWRMDGPTSPGALSLTASIRKIDTTSPQAVRLDILRLTCRSENHCAHTAKFGTVRIVAKAPLGFCSRTIIYSKTRRHNLTQHKRKRTFV